MADPLPPHPSGVSPEEPDAWNALVKARAHMMALPSDGSDKCARLKTEGIIRVTCGKTARYGVDGSLLCDDCLRELFQAGKIAVNRETQRFCWVPE